MNFCNQTTKIILTTMSSSKEISPLKFYKQRKKSGLGFPRKLQDKEKWVNGCFEYIATNMVCCAVTEAAKVVSYKQYYEYLKQLQYRKKEKIHKESNEDTIKRNHHEWIFKKAEERVERLKRELENAEDILTKAREAKEALE